MPLYVSIVEAIETPIHVAFYIDYIDTSPRIYNTGHTVASPHAYSTVRINASPHAYSRGAIDASSSD